MKLIEVILAQGIALVFIVGISMGTGAFLWPYSINAWLVYAGKEPAMVWWYGAIAGAFPPFGFISIPVSLITFVAMLFLA